MSNLALPVIRDWPKTRHLYWLERAGELVDQVAPSIQLVFRAQRATALLLLGEESGWDAVHDIPTSGSDPDTQKTIARASMNVALGMRAWGRYDEARRQLATAAEHIRQLGYQRFESAVQGAQAYVDWYTGTWQGLDTTARELAEADESDPIDQLHARQLLGLLALAQGSRAATQHLRDVAGKYARLGVAEPPVVLAPAALGRLCLAEGNGMEATRVTGPVVSMIAAKQVWLWATDIAAVHLDALVATGDLDQAGEFFAQLGDEAGQKAEFPPLPRSLSIMV